MNCFSTLNFEFCRTDIAAFEFTKDWASVADAIARQRAFNNARGGELRAGLEEHETKVTTRNDESVGTYGGTQDL